MNVNVVILPFDEVPEECKFHGSHGVDIGGIYRNAWDKAYEASIHGNLIVDLEDFEVDEGIVYVQNAENLIFFWTNFECIDLKRTVLCEEILQYLVNYF